MNKLMVYALSVTLLLGTVVGGSAWAQYGGGGETPSTQKATPEQVKECKDLGIPEFTCTEQTLLAKRRVVAAGQQDAYGSGTAMLSKGFGEMGGIIVALAAIFGGVAVAFFAKSRVGKKAEA